MEVTNQPTGDSMATTKNSGLQRLKELAPDLKASTERFKKHNDELAARQLVEHCERPSQTQIRSAWGDAVKKLTNNA